MIGDSFLLECVARRGFPLAVGLRLSYRASPGAKSPTYHNLTGWAFTGSAVAIAGSEADVEAGADVAFSPSFSIASPQSGSTQGVFYVSVPSATTADQLGDWYACDIVATPPEANPRVIGRLLIRFTDSSTENPDADAETVILPDTIIDGTASSTGETRIQLVEAGPIGPTTSGTGGQPYLIKGVTANLLTTGAKNLYTASAGCVVTGVVLRLTTVSGLSAVPVLNIQRLSGVTATDANNADSLVGLTTTGLAYVYNFNGTVPTLASGDVLRLNVTTAADASGYTVTADVLGYAT